MYTNKAYMGITVGAYMCLMIVFKRVYVISHFPDAHYGSLNCKYNTIYCERITNVCLSDKIDYNYNLITV